MEVCTAHLQSAPERPWLRRDGLPGDIEAVIVRCLEKATAARYPDARALRRALLACSSASEWNDERAAAWWREHGGPFRAHREAHRAASFEASPRRDVPRPRS